MFRKNAILLQANAIVFRGNIILLRENAIVFRANEIPFPRERNTYFRVMKLMTISLERNSIS